MSQHFVCATCGRGGETSGALDRVVCHCGARAAVALPATAGGYDPLAPHTPDGQGLDGNAYLARLKEARAQAGGEPPEPQIIDLMAALKAALAERS